MQKLSDVLKRYGFGQFAVDPPEGAPVDVEVRILSVEEDLGIEPEGVENDD